MGEDRRVYRELIDELVRQCRSGQGAIGPRRVRSGVWNPHITKRTSPDQHQYNQFLARLAEKDRELLAKLLNEEFVGGVHTTLVALHEAEIPPFDTGYEGTPFHDFMGRLLIDWHWPE